MWKERLGSVVLSHAPLRAREPAFLTGRKLAPVEAVAKDIVSAETAEVDALDEQAVDKHLQSVIDQAGRVDISFNAVGIPNTKILGVPLVELDVEQFSLLRAPPAPPDRPGSERTGRRYPSER